MGSGTMKCKSYHTNKGYYLAKDYDERFGGEFFFLLLPFFENNGERFFYVTTEKNSYTVEGEYYIIMDESKVRKEVRLFQKELGKNLFGIITKITKEGFYEKKSTPNYQTPCSNLGQGML